MSNEKPQGMTPAMVLRQHPAPWQSVTYTDGTIRVFDANTREVGLLDILTLTMGVVNAPRKTAAATASADAG